MKLVLSHKKAVEPFQSGFLLLDVHTGSDYNVMFSRKWNAKAQARWNQCVLHIYTGDGGCFKRKFLQSCGVGETSHR